MSPADATLPLPPGEIHLWFCRHGESGDPALEAACRALLEPHELARTARFHFQRDRHRHLLTRVLVRTVLSRYAPVQPQDWRFAEGSFGRPCIAEPMTQAVDGLDFNLSHTDGLIVLALARNLEVGVDAESLARTASLELADHFFSPAEAKALAALPPTRRAHRFFELWTLKESYIKARGMGLQIPLDSFGFALDDADDRIGFALWGDARGDNAPHRHFWQLRPTPGHLVAVCAATDGSGMRLVCRDIAPLQWERPLDIRAVRSGGSAGI